MPFGVISECCWKFLVFSLRLSVPEEEEEEKAILESET